MKKDKWDLRFVLLGCSSLHFRLAKTTMYGTSPFALSPVVAPSIISVGLPRVMQRCLFLCQRRALLGYLVATRACSSVFPLPWPGAIVLPAMQAAPYLR